MKLTKAQAKEYDFNVDKDKKIAIRKLDEKGNAIIVLEEDKLYLSIFGARINVKRPSENKLKNIISCFDEQSPELPF